MGPGILETAKRTYRGLKVGKFWEDVKTIWRAWRDIRSAKGGSLFFTRRASQEEIADIRAYLDGKKYLARKPKRKSRVNNTDNSL